LGIGSNAVKCWTANCQTGVYIREHRINLPVYHGVLVIGIGLFISNYTDTQQQAMFIAWFFTVIFYSNEWIVYSYRKHAELGSTSDFVQSHPLFCGNNSDGNA
jgi:hypothetical protein